MDSNLTIKFWEHCLHTNDPVDELISSGTIDPLWVESFNELYNEVYGKWIHKEMLPQKIVASLVHVSRLHVTYGLWCDNNSSSNKETFKTVNRLFEQSLTLLMNGQNV